MRTSMALFLVAGSLAAAEPTPGQKMFDAYFRRQVGEISAACLSDIRSKEDWERRRPEYRRQFLDMLGLWPLPQRSDLKARTTETIDAGTFVVEKLHFQSRPGLYVTGNLYVPKGAKALPAVLYVCGHGNVVKNGVSFGSKVHYQHHPTWFAQNGYVCLVLDTLQLGEVAGIHHGTSRFGNWWWQSRGYTPAGVECWNAMRALDFLQSRPEVDPNRLGVTGRSGGGATSWWVAAADDRVQCIIPVAGIGDMYAHLIEGELSPYQVGGVIGGHCDCMYMVNTYRWDFPMVMALCAPRPLLLGNSDVDAIFPVGGYRRMHKKVAHIYSLYGAGEKFQMLETAGPHKDTPELRLGAFRWLNRWLKNDMSAVTEVVRDPFTPEQLKVLESPPADVENHRVQDWFVAKPSVEIPRDFTAAKAWWARTRPEYMAHLESRVFHAWPRPPILLDACLACDITRGGLRLRAFDFSCEADARLRLWIETAAGVETPTEIIAMPLDENQFRDWLRSLGPNFADAFPGVKMPPPDESRFRQSVATLAHSRAAYVTIAPRGIGPTKFADAGTKEETLMRRRFALVGQTLEGQQVWDVRRALSVACSQWQKLPAAFVARGDMASIALHAAIFEPGVTRLDLWDLPRSYSDGPAYLNIWRKFDMPQTIALALPRDLRLHVRTQAEAQAWKDALRGSELLHPGLVKIRLAGD